VDPGGGDRAADVQKIFEDNKRTAGIRMQEEAAQSLEIEGTGNLHPFEAGRNFTLKDHPNADGVYVLTEVTHSARYAATYETGKAGEDEPYENTFTCIPEALPYRPARETPRPIVRGSQTAVVVGPSGEEIFTDKYGRVKVQFPWDRQGQLDASSSCWVRVSTPWAGKQWGMIHIPRIGQEVVVDFLEGDPDQPIVVGSVWNADQMPPYALPDNRTQSGIKSRSSLKGEPAHFNELRFEDKKGSEQVYFHAEKDFRRVVENNDDLTVGIESKEGSQTIKVHKDRTITVLKGHETTTIDEGNRVQTVKKGNETLTVGKGNRTISVDTGNELHEIKTGTRTLKVNGDDLHQIAKGKRSLIVETGDDEHVVKKGKRTVLVETGDDVHTVKMGKRSVSIEMGNDELSIKMGNHTTKLDLGKYGAEAMQGIELKVGQSSILIDQMGVTIKGMMITVDGQLMTTVKAGVMLDMKGSAMAKLGGGITMIG
jgi:type VI secretion system secreted protein VgrG